MTIKILIVDDHFVVREGLKLILETNQRYEVIAEASNGKEAIRRVDTYNPDIILLDLNMPEMGGLDTMTALRAKGMDIPIIILTTYNEDEMMIRGLALGAKGYLLKDTGREMIFRSIDAAMRGKRCYFRRSARKYLLTRHQKRRKSHPPRGYLLQTKS